MQEKKDLLELLKNNNYPGRGIVIGNSEDGKQVIFYFIMGRSENSRNRIFQVEEDGISTKAFDESKMVDPSLIIYHPVRRYKNDVIVTNGDQTDTILEGLKGGKTFEESLRERCFEPDAPNYTPRISGLLHEDGSYELSILKAMDSDGEACLRETFSYPKVNGLGHFLHTYKEDGNPIPSFEGEPTPISLGNNMDEMVEDVWKYLNEDNKVSLYVYVRIEDEEKKVIFNKNEGEE